MIRMRGCPSRSCMLRRRCFIRDWKPFPVEMPSVEKRQVGSPWQRGAALGLTLEMIEFRARIDDAVQVPFANLEAKIGILEVAYHVVFAETAKFDCQLPAHDQACACHGLDDLYPRVRGWQ